MARLFHWEVLSTSTPIEALIRQLNRRLGELARTLSGGSGVVRQVATATATTLFTVPLPVKGLYTVFATIPGGGAAGMASAQFGSDGVTLVRLTGVNGANLALTNVAGAVQATQTTGAPKDVYWSYTQVN
jgi:hypothetical protein